jgi:RimJ/RimL family protein N-acetyltransferase
VESDGPRVFTGRLELIAATATLARAATTSAEEFARLLDAEVPKGWPPELMSDQQAEWARQLEVDPQLAGWSAWYIVQVSPPVLVGSIGLSGRPDGDGTVECGYALVTNFRRKGYATEAMGGLIDWAFSHEEVRSIRAHTYPHLAESIRVLEKNGLSHVGAGDEPGTLRFELRRP